MRRYVNYVLPILTGLLVLWAVPVVNDLEYPYISGILIFLGTMPLFVKASRYLADRAGWRRTHVTLLFGVMGIGAIFVHFAVGWALFVSAVIGVTWTYLNAVPKGDKRHA